MQNALTIYFQGEKNAGLCLAGIGLVGLAAAAVFFPARWNVRSFAITLGVLALVQLAIGVGLYLKTGPQVAALLSKLSSDSGAFYVDEGARMAKVQRNFVILEYAWIALIAASAVVAVALKARFRVTGIALALLVNFAIILTFDLIAERRGAVYLAALQARSLEK
jgi:hypothetical protein